jgi:hypothetical protein
MQLPLCLIKNYAMTSYGWLEVQFHVFLISSMGGGEGWSQLHALAALPPAKISPGNNCIGGCVGPRLGVNDVEKII